MSTQSTSPRSESDNAAELVFTSLVVAFFLPALVYIGVLMALKFWLGLRDRYVVALGVAAASLLVIQSGGDPRPAYTDDWSDLYHAVRADTEKLDRVQGVVVELVQPQPVVLALAAACVLLLGLARRIQRGTPVENERRRLAGERAQSRGRALVRTPGRALGLIESPPKEPHVVLGRKIEGDLPARRGKVTLPLSVFTRGAVVVGATGSGKSTTIETLVAQLVAHHVRVGLIDAKGDPFLLRSFRARMRAAGLSDAEVGVWPGRPYDAWRGDIAAVRNRLLAVHDFSEPFYEGAARLMLTHALRTGEVSTAAELVRRLHEITLQAREYGFGAEAARGVHMRYAAWHAVIMDWLDRTPKSWAFEDVRASYFYVDSLGLSDDAAVVGRLLIEDYAHYAGVRKKPGTDVLVVDEFSALGHGAGAIVNIYERARSRGAGSMLTTQSIAALGDAAPRILETAACIIAHRLPDPDSILPYLGTRLVREHTRQTHEGLLGLGSAYSGLGSESYAESHPIRPSALRLLKTGEALVILDGRWAIVRVEAAPALDPATAVRPRLRPPPSPEPAPGESRLPWEM